MEFLTLLICHITISFSQPSLVMRYSCLFFSQAILSIELKDSISCYGTIGIEPRAMLNTQAL